MYDVGTDALQRAVGAQDGPYTRFLAFFCLLLSRLNRGSFFCWLEFGKACGAAAVGAQTRVALLLEL